jgi:hypothetical protein
VRRGLDLEEAEAVSRVVCVISMFERSYTNENTSTTRNPHGECEGLSLGYRVRRRLIYGRLTFEATNWGRTSNGPHSIQLKLYLWG